MENLDNSARSVSKDSSAPVEGTSSEPEPDPTTLSEQQPRKKAVAHRRLVQNVTKKVIEDLSKDQPQQALALFDKVTDNFKGLNLEASDGSFDQQAKTNDTQELLQPPANLRTTLEQARSVLYKMKTDKDRAIAAQNATAAAIAAAQKAQRQQTAPPPCQLTGASVPGGSSRPLVPSDASSDDVDSDQVTLAEACVSNDVETARELLDSGHSANDVTDEGDPLLLVACGTRCLLMAELLLNFQARVEDRGKNDCTPLMESAGSNSVDIIQLLLTHGADVNALSGTGDTALHIGARKGFDQVVTTLIKAGSALEEQNENGHTPLMEAASAGHVVVAGVLLVNGAGINTHSNEFKESALTLACYKGHYDMVKYLLQSGADLDHKTDEMHTALMEASMDGHTEVARLLLEHGAQVNMPEDSFESPLTLAACGGHMDLANLLISHGARLEEVNDEGYTPLMEASREGHEEMVRLLHEKGSDINAQTEETQETALTLACCGGFLEVADYLIKEGADIELGCSTPLMEAAQEGHTTLVKHLLACGANVLAETSTMDTALTVTCENGHVEVASILIEAGAIVDHATDGGRTPLMKAARGGHTSCLDYLIKVAAEINKLTSNGDHTALSLACAGGHTLCVEHLLIQGADPTIRLKDNMNAMMEAARGGHATIVKLLMDYPKNIRPAQNKILMDSMSQQVMMDDKNQMAERLELFLNKMMTSQSDEQFLHSVSPDNMVHPPCPVDMAAISGPPRGDYTPTQMMETSLAATEGRRRNPVPLHVAVQQHLHCEGVVEGNVGNLAQALQNWDKRRSAVTNTVSDVNTMVKPMPVFPMVQGEGDEGDLSPLPAVGHYMERQEGYQTQTNLLANTLATANVHHGSANMHQGSAAMHQGSAAMHQGSAAMHQGSDIMHHEAHPCWTPDPMSDQAFTQQMYENPELLKAAQGQLAQYQHVTQMQQHQQLQLAAMGAPANGSLHSGVSDMAPACYTGDNRSVVSPTPLSPLGSSPSGCLEEDYQTTVDLNIQTDSNNDTALTFSASGGHNETTQLLVMGGAKTEHRDKKGFTPLILAATGGHLATVATLLDNGAQIEAVSDRTKDSALSLACSGGKYEVVELLLKKGANKEHRNVSDYTPLSLAASGGYVNIIQLLLNYEADINSRTNSKLGISPLMLAAMNGHTAAVRLLLDKGSDINAQIETNRNTALTLACFQGRHEVVALLVERNANIEHRAKTGLTPLMEAASGGYVEVGRVLLSKGADVNAPPVPSSKDTALTIAADKGHYRFVDLLIKAGANVNAKNKKGNSPLWLACSGGHLDVVQLLVNAKSCVDSQDNRKVSCLMASFRKGHVKVVRWLVKHVNHYPSDAECKRFNATLSDQELLQKCGQCMDIIVTAKDRQAAEANKHASILLKEIDQEKEKEERKRESAAKKRERKKQKKKEKQQSTGAGVNAGTDDKQKSGESSKSSSPAPPAQGQENGGDSEKGDMAQELMETSSSPVSTSPLDRQSAETEATAASARPASNKADQSQSVKDTPLMEVTNLKDPVHDGKTTAVDEAPRRVNETVGKQRPASASAGNTRGGKRNRNKRQHESTAGGVGGRKASEKADGAEKESEGAPRPSSEDTKADNARVVKEKSAIGELDDFEMVSTSPKSKSSKGRNTERSYQEYSNTVTYPTSRSVTKPTTNMAATSAAGSALSFSAPIPSPGKKGKRGDEGWKEVVRKSKKITIPHQVAGRVLKSLPAIREFTKANIDVDKPTKSGDRNATVRGHAEPTRLAYNLITTLISEPDKTLDDLIHHQRKPRGNNSNHQGGHHAQSHQHQANSSTNHVPSLTSIHTTAPSAVLGEDTMTQIGTFNIGDFIVTSSASGGPTPRVAPTVDAKSRSVQVPTGTKSWAPVPPPTAWQRSFTAAQPTSTSDSSTTVTTAGGIHTYQPGSTFTSLPSTSGFSAIPKQPGSPRALASVSVTTQPSQVHPMPPSGPVGTRRLVSGPLPPHGPTEGGVSRQLFSPVTTSSGVTPFSAASMSSTTPVGLPTNVSSSYGQSYSTPQPYSNSPVSNLQAGDMARTASDVERAQNIMSMGPNRIPSATQVRQPFSGIPQRNHMLLHDVYNNYEMNSGRLSSYTGSNSAFASMPPAPITYPGGSSNRLPDPAKAPGYRGTSKLAMGDSSAIRGDPALEAASMYQHQSSSGVHGHEYIRSSPSGYHHNNPLPESGMYASSGGAGQPGQQYPSNDTSLLDYHQQPPSAYNNYTAGAYTTSAISSGIGGGATNTSSASSPRYSAANQPMTFGKIKPLNPNARNFQSQSNPLSATSSVLLDPTSAFSTQRLISTGGESDLLSAGPRGGTNPYGSVGSRPMSQSMYPGGPGVIGRNRTPTPSMEALRPLSAELSPDGSANQSPRGHMADSGLPKPKPIGGERSQWNMNHQPQGSAGLARIWGQSSNSGVTGHPWLPAGAPGYDVPPHPADDHTGPSAPGDSSFNLMGGAAFPSNMHPMLTPMAAPGPAAGDGLPPWNPAEKGDLANTIPQPLNQPPVVVPSWTNWSTGEDKNP